MTNVKVDILPEGLPSPRPSHVGPERGLSWWWDVDDFVETEVSWTPEGPPLERGPMRKYKLPSPSGYNG